MSAALAAAYATLGLAPGASPEEVKRAWRKTARATHPDLHPDDPDAARRFKEAEAAHALLTDPARRARAERGEGAEAGAGRWGFPGWGVDAGGPDDDWFDAVGWMAEAHYIRLRREALPRYAAWSRGGPSLAAALAAAADQGIADHAPDITPGRWARFWDWSLWRRVDLIVDDGRPFGRGPVGLVARAGRAQIYVWPRALWDQGVRDDEAVRRVVQRSVDMAVATAALIVLGLPTVDLAPPPGADRRWWAAQLFWPVVVMVVVFFSVFLIGNAWIDANTAHLRR